MKLYCKNKKHEREATYKLRSETKRLKEQIKQTLN